MLDDLESLGMLDETLVLVTGEFGRTPKIGHDAASGNGKPGHDHWPRASAASSPAPACAAAK